MKFTELCDYPLPGGIVTEWVPDTTNDPLSWTHDPRPPTYDHEAALHDRWEPGDHQTSWLGAVFEMNRRYDPTCLEHALRQWVVRHEAFRTIVDHSLRRHTCDGADVHMRAEVIGNIDSGAQVGELLTRRFDQYLSPSRWPHVRVASITSLTTVSPDDGFVLVFAADHVVMDAYSIMLSINEIGALYRSAIDGSEPDLAEVGSHVDFSCDDRRTGSELTGAHPAVGLWRRFHDTHDRGRATFAAALHPPRLEANCAGAFAPQRGSSEFIVDAGEASALTRHSRDHGTSTQDAVFAAMAVAHRVLTDDPLLRLVMPWHTRHQPQYRESVGWYVGLGPLEVDLCGATTFAQALAATHHGIAAACAASRAPHRRVNEIIGSTIEPEFVASYLDLRGVPGAPEWLHNHARTLRSASYSDREVYVWIARVPTGITFSSRFPDSTLAADTMERFVSLVTSVLRTVAASGTDLPLDEYTTEPITLAPITLAEASRTA